MTPASNSLTDRDLTRRLLSDLSPAKEKRKGKWSYIAFVLSFGILGILSVGLLTISYGLPSVLILLSLSFFPCIMFFMVLEQNLIGQNYSSLMIEFIQPHLNAEEKVLVCFFARLWQLKIPSILADDVYPACCFFFTSDRLLIVTVKGSKIGFGSLAKFFSAGNFNDVVLDFHTCDYLDTSSLKIGGFIRHIFYYFTHTKITLAPLDNREHSCWIAGTANTQSGRILKEIHYRIQNKNRFSF